MLSACIVVAVIVPETFNASFIVTAVESSDFIEFVVKIGVLSCVPATTTPGEYTVSVYHIRNKTIISKEDKKRTSNDKAKLFVQLAVVIILILSLFVNTIIEFFFVFL